ncbi:MAG TPA: transketolase [Candidatus Atribacteria bacterium]|nr:transketolase [Candidatus Atribacteria bacterium]
MKELNDPRKVFGNQVLELAKQDPRILAVSTDSSGSSGFGPFKECFPERHLEFGLTEQSAIGFCAGLALSGKIPFFCAITPFITMRCFEQVRDDLVYTFANVKIAGRNSGLDYSYLGYTHQSLEDIAVMRSLSNMKVLVPSDAIEIRACVNEAAKYTGPVYIRIGSEKLPTFHQSDYHFSFGKGEALQKGKDITLITMGGMVWRTMEAAEELVKLGIEVGVISMPSIKPLDYELLLQVSKETDIILTIEDHSIVGGLGGAVSEFLSQENPIRVVRLGVPDVFSTTGSYGDLLEKYHLSKSGIVDYVINLVKKKKSSYSN